jgi:alkylation response protein AidB-like acyl-CoA dehydrogenase
MSPAIEHCLRADTQAASTETVAQWWPRWRAGSAAGASPIERAIVGGFEADRVAWAFASGYQAALRALVPGLPDEALSAFCVTEEAGNRPRDVQATITLLDDGSVSISGAKRWTTLGPDSSLLLVVGRLHDAGASGERPQLRVARVPSGTPGLSLIAMPPTRFVPEVPHARVQLDNVRLPASSLLPGDGYAQAVKPFRTLEDTHVTAAVLAYLLREARARSWPVDLRERLAATLIALVAVAAGSADAPATHVVLEGALRWAHQLYAEAGPLWAAAADDAAARWQRDAALFAVAGTARAQRAARAWERIAEPRHQGDSNE